MAEPTELEPPEELLSEIGCEAGDEPVDTFVWSSAGKTKFFLGMAGVIAFGATIFALFGWIALTQMKSAGERAGMLAFGALLFGVFVWVAWAWVKHYRTSADRVIVYETGVVWHSAGGGWEAGRWSAATEFHRLETRSDGESVSRCSVKFRDGTKVTFAAQLQNYQSLAGHVQHLMHLALLPVLKAQYEAGEEVEFGRIVLTPTEFISKAGGGFLEWRKPLDEIREAEIANGCLWLNHRTNRTKGFMIALGDIPNYTVLFALFPFHLHGWKKDAFGE